MNNIRQSVNKFPDDPHNNFQILGNFRQDGPWLQEQQEELPVPGHASSHAHAGPVHQPDDSAP